MECSERTPSVIARLMGLDTLPPQQPVHKQQPVLSENYLRKTAYIGVREKRSSPEGSSFRMKIDKQQNCKDIFEVPETAMEDECCGLPIQMGKVNVNLTDAEMKSTRQSDSNRDTKSLSLDEKLQRSKKSHDAFEVADSNRDLFLKYLQQPNSLLAKHLKDLQGVNHITVLNSSNASNYGDSKSCRTSNMEFKQGIVMKSTQENENGPIAYFHGDLDADYSDKFPKPRSEPSNNTCLSTAKIVVLKPKLQKVQRSISPSSHKDPMSGDRKYKDVSSLEFGNSFIKVAETKDLMYDMEYSRYRSTFSTETAKEVTSHMRRNMSSSFEEASRSTLRSTDTSMDESEVVTPSSPNSSNWNYKYQTSLSHSNGSLLAQVAKKHISERWKTTTRFQEVGLAGRGRSLGEMLAMPDLEIGLKKLDCRLPSKHGLHNCLGLSSEDPKLCNPSGISSWDGWKDGCANKSQSLPATSIGILKSKTRLEALHSDLNLMAMQAVSQGQHKSKIDYLDQKNGSRTRNLKSISRKLKSCSHLDLRNDNNVIVEENKIDENHLTIKNSVDPTLPVDGNSCMDTESNCVVRGTWVTQDELKDKFGKDFSEQISTLCSSLVDVGSTSMVSDPVNDAKTERMFSEIGMEQQPKTTACTLLKDRNSSSHVLESSNQQDTSTGSPKESSIPLHYPRLEPKSPVSSEDVSQSSPVSVLGSPSQAEISSDIEGFESVSADLRGLWMQLQLLKADSLEECSEGPGMNVSSDENDGEESVDLEGQDRELTGISNTKESRDFSYLVDVLVEAGLSSEKLELCLKKWHYPEFPINPVVFETLEKKYGHQTHWENSERRLLFDRINSSLMEILQSCIHVKKQSKSILKSLSCRQSWEVIEEELWMLLVSQEKEAIKNSSDNVLGRDMEWLEFGDDINAIGREIEGLLIEELAAECVNAESF